MNIGSIFSRRETAIGVGAESCGFTPAHFNAVPTESVTLSWRPDTQNANVGGIPTSTALSPAANGIRFSPGAGEGLQVADKTMGDLFGDTKRGLVFGGLAGGAGAAVGTWAGSAIGSAAGHQVMGIAVGGLLGLVVGAAVGWHKGASS